MTGDPAARRPDAPQLVGVVVPAHEEEARIGACMASVRRALRHPALSKSATALVIVLDDCTDGTGERALHALGRYGPIVIEHSARNVGLSRQAGMATLMAAASGLRPDRVWLATTDADTRVGEDWLATQLAWEATGAEAVAGTVTVDGWHEQPSRVRRLYGAHMAALGQGMGHPHVHGANLGLTGAAYDAVGGMPPLARAEDHALWAGLRRAGRRAVAVGNLPVTTSARREGRAPQGFSGLLRRLDAVSHRAHAPGPA